MRVGMKVVGMGVGGVEVGVRIEPVLFVGVVFNVSMQAIENCAGDSWGGANIATYST